MEKKMGIPLELFLYKNLIYFNAVVRYKIIKDNNKKCTINK